MDPVSGVEVEAMRSGIGDASSNISRAREREAFLLLHALLNLVKPVSQLIE